MDSALITKFEGELRRRVTLRANPSTLPHKVLVDSFRYFDLANTGCADWAAFRNVALIKFGLMGLTEDDLKKLFGFYGGGSPSLDYRKFAGEVFQVQVPSVRASSPSPSQIKPGMDARSFEDRLSADLDILGESSAVLLFRGLQKAVHLGKNLSFNEFVQLLAEVRIKLSREESAQLEQRVKNGDRTLQPEVLLDRWFPALSGPKKEIVQAAFDSLNHLGFKGLLFERLWTDFRGREHPDWVARRRSESEIKNEFFDALKTYLRADKGDHSFVSPESFEGFFKVFGRNWDPEQTRFFFQAMFGCRDLAKVGLPPRPPQTAPDKPASIIKTSQQSLGRLPPDPSLNFDSPSPLVTQTINQQLEDTISRRAASAELDRQQALKERLREQVIAQNDPCTMLRLELGLVAQCEALGSVDFEVFAGELERQGLLRGFKTVEVSHLFLGFTQQGGPFNIQQFANQVRGQMGPAREAKAIELFRRLAGGRQTLPLSELRRDFLPKRFESRRFRGFSEARAMFDEAVDLFECLNRPVRGRGGLSLDELLYFLDNFSMGMAETQFGEFLFRCFNQ